MAGGVFSLLNRPDEAGVTIILSSPTAVVSTQDGAGPPVVLDARTDINTATSESLMALPGIGEVKAQAIVDYRTREGPFRRTDERLRDLVKVGGGP